MHERSTSGVKYKLTVKFYSWLTSVGQYFYLENIEDSGALMTVFDHRVILSARRPANRAAAIACDPVADLAFSNPKDRA